MLRYGSCKAWFCTNRLVLQKLMGLAFLVITALVLWFAANGATAEDRDATAALITAPMGGYLLLTKQHVIL